MPQADIPANQHSPSPIAPQTKASLGEPIAGPADLPVSQRPEEEDWQTVDFPNALSVDAIPLVEKNQAGSATPPAPASAEGVTPQAFRPIRPPSVPMESLNFDLSQVVAAAGVTGTPVTLIQALHECNRDLVQRVTQLEAALEESQNTLEELQIQLQQRESEAQTAQSEVTRLFSKLELANQIIQRQEISHESLSNQWEASQLRLAQVERESALTQKRYHEQQHQLVQAESSCRELRSRLHRQQRHTLQFKAALERYLEMPIAVTPGGTRKVENLEEVSLAESPLPSAGEVSNKSDVGLGKPSPKSSPVKPWSAALEGLGDTAEIGSAWSRRSTEPEPPVSPSLEVETYWHLEATPTVNATPGETSVNSPVVNREQPLESGGDGLSFNLGATAGEFKPVEMSAGFFENPLEADQSLSSQSAGIREPIGSPLPDWLRVVNYASGSKKRRSLAEIELPTFS